MLTQYRVAVLLVGALAGLQIVNAQQDDLGRRLSRAFDVIEDAVATSPVPGIVVGITDRDRTLKVIAHGYADLKANTPIRADSMFEIGSISKSFTAIALMQLFDEGKFDPKSPITRYLPWFEVQSKFGPITGHHLLTHTSGLPNYRPDLASMSYATFSLRDFEVSYAPGEHYWYSNIGFQTLGYALERIERSSYRAIIERRILSKIGMASTVAIIDDEMRAKLPASYTQWPYTNEYVEEPWFEYRAADGSIASTAGDMLAYTRMILNRGLTSHGRLLSENAFTILTTPAANSYAYGLNVREADGNVVIGHGGGIAGFNTLMEAYMNDGFGIVVLGNASLNPGLNAWIASTVKAAIRNQPFPVLPARQSADQAMAAAAEWAGIYEDHEGKRLDFIATSNGLALKRADSTTQLTRSGRDTFRSSSTDLVAFPFAFERENGKLVAVSHGPDWFAGAAYKGTKEFKTPAEYLPLVGRYVNHNPEGAFVRVFVRKGQLILARGRTEGSPLVQLGPMQFRPGSPDYNPERYRFDTIVDGRALRLFASGMPMYRVEEN